MRFLIAARFLRKLLLEATALLFRIIQLAEGIADFETADKNLKALHPFRLVLLVLRQRRDRDREVVQDSGLPEMFFCHSFEHVRDGLTCGLSGIVRHMRSVLSVQPLHEVPYRTGTSKVRHLRSRRATLRPIFDDGLS